MKIKTESVLDTLIFIILIRNDFVYASQVGLVPVAAYLFPHFIIVTCLSIPKRTTFSYQRSIYFLFYLLHNFVFAWRTAGNNTSLLFCYAISLHCLFAPLGKNCVKVLLHASTIIAVPFIALICSIFRDPV